MRLRQVALAATDLAATVDALTDVLGIEVGFRDPGVAVFGLENAVMPVGETHLEVVSPVRDDATARRWIAKRGGDAGYMVILQCEDHAALDAEVARAQRAGAKAVWEGEHEGARTVHFHPRELGAILSFDAMPAWNDWVWGGPDWRSHVRTGTATAIRGVLLESPDPERLAARWGELLGIAPAPDSGGRPRITLPRGGRLVFVPSRGGEGIAGVELALADPARFEQRARARGVLGADGAATIAGTRFIPTEDTGVSRTIEQEALETYARFVATRDEIDVGAKPWSALADFFTEDAAYIDPAWGRIEGREAIRSFFVESMAGLTGHGWSTPENWTMAEGPRVVSQWDQILGHKDDGTPWLVPGLSILYYAGDGLFCYSHDMLNMTHIGQTMRAMGWTPPAEFNMPPRHPNRDVSLPPAWAHLEKRRPRNT